MQSATNTKTESDCIICYKIINANLFSNESEKLYTTCCKYLHSAIISEPLNTKSGRTPFCENCLSSAVELSGLIEQLEFCQKSISEMVFLFSLGILHRRGESGDNKEEKIRHERKLTQVDIAGLPDLKPRCLSNALPSTKFQEIICKEDANPNFRDYIEVCEVAGNDYFVQEDVKLTKFDVDENEGVDEISFLDTPDANDNLHPVTQSSSITITGIEYDGENKLSENYDFSLPIPQLQSLAMGLDPLDNESYQEHCKNRKNNTLKQKIGESNITVTVGLVDQDHANQDAFTSIDDNGEEIPVSCEIIKPMGSTVTNIEAESSGIQIITNTNPISLSSTGRLHRFGNSPIKSLRQITPEINTETRFRCKVCKREFKYRTTLLSHERVHSGEKPFECSVCSRAFAMQSNLKRHKKIHTRPFKCNICNKRFSLKHLYLDHVATHSGVKNHKCSFCDYAATTASALRYHKDTGHSNTIFKCRECGKVFKLIDQIKKHYKRVHFAIEFSSSECAIAV